jgi:hypothetical protein
MRQEDVITMRALVVYESMYGNTQVIAGNIADGLRGDYEVTLVPAPEATRLPPHCGSGELPGRLAERAARRRGRAGPPVGHDARRDEQDVPARAGLRIAKAR